MARSVAIIGTRGYPSYYGGFETAVRKLAPYLVERDWDVTVYGRAGSTLDNDPTRDPRVQTRVTAGLETKSVSTLSYGLTATLDARKRRPDVALIMNVANGYFIPLLKRRGIPSLVNVDGIEWDRQKWGRLAKAAFRNGAKWTAKHGSVMVYDSHEIARRWKQDFGRDGLFIPYGGDDPGELPIEPGLTHRQYVLIVARFVPENTVPEFFGAVEKLARDHDVVMVGSAGYGGELDQMARSLAERHSRVQWLGHVSDDQRLLALWQHSGVYFHGHSVGGTNPALVQAMACGAPVIARDTVYNREVLGENGHFTQPDEANIAASISAMLSSPSAQEEASRDARARAEETYTWEKVCSAYERGLADLVAK